ncbi:MAG: hypothetical protein ABR981_01685 [Candidatus Micrarchaeaceae archaeon]|jgi:hypothetical protein
MKIEDRKLFLKYALPCASTFVTRGTLTQEHLNDLIRTVSDDNLPNENVEEMFKVANAMCKIIAMRMNKSSIDSEVIRQYFLLEHSKVVDDRYELMRDFNPIDCKTYAGIVTKTENGHAIVKTSRGEREYKTLFAKNAREKDMVVVHFDFIVELITEDTFKKMQTAELEYGKRN